MSKNSSKSKIPVAGKFRPSKKSQNENLKQEVNKTKALVKISQPAPAPETKRRHLSVVNANTRDGSKSSISDVEEVFYTAGKEETFDERLKGGRVIDERPRGVKSYKSSNKKTVNEKHRNETSEGKTKISKAKKSYQINSEVISDKTTKSPTKLSDFLTKIKLDVDRQEPLPEGVINIEMEDGLYEYSREVVVYLMEMENTTTVPHDFLEDGSVTANMRSILVDWIIQVQHHLKLCQETLYLAIGMLDLVLLRRDVDPDKLQLVGVTALLVASKLEEYYPVDIKKLLHLTENSYKRVEVTHMERVLLDVMEFQVYLPSPQVFLLRYTRASLRSQDSEFLKTCQYLLDSHLPHSSHPCCTPSLVAAAAVLATSLLNYLAVNNSFPKPSTIWTPTLVHYTTYNLTLLAPTSLQMVEQVIAAMLATSKFTGAMVKYKSHSQHQRLALAKHLQVDVLRRGRTVLEDWGK